MPGIGQVQGCLDSGYSATDDQGGVRDRHLFLVLWVEPLCAGYSNFDNAHGLFSGCFPIARRDPGTVFADIGHLQQIGVKAGSFDASAKDRLVGSRRARCDNHAIQVVFGNRELNFLLAWFSASIFIANGCSDTGQTLGIFPQVFRINHTGDV